jgi:hypothetical protein
VRKEKVKNIFFVFVFIFWNFQPIMMVLGIFQANMTHLKVGFVLIGKLKS